MTSIFLAVSLLAQVPSPTESQPETMGVLEVLGAWEAGVSLIENYDLSLELNQKTFVEQDPASGEWKLLSEADAIIIPPSYSRIYRRGVKRRGEFGGDGRDDYTTHMIWDGGRSHKFYGQNNVEVDRFIFTFGGMQYEDYEANFRNYLGTVDRIALARTRRPRLMSREGRLYVVDVPFGTQGDYANFHWRAWLDPDRNYLPAKLMHWYVQKNAEEPSLEIENDLVEVAKGVFAPVRSRIRTFFQDKKSALYRKVSGFRELKVITERSRFDIEPPDSLFDPTIPNGSTVLDRMRNAVFTQGSENADKFLSELAADEKKKLSKVPERDRGPSQTVFVPDNRGSAWSRWGWIALLTLPAIISVFFLARRLRRRGA